jgi:hypothetical protein
MEEVKAHHNTQNSLNNTMNNLLDVPNSHAASKHMNNQSQNMDYGAANTVQVVHSMESHRNSKMGNKTLSHQNSSSQLSNNKETSMINKYIEKFSSHP